MKKVMEWNNKIQNNPLLLLTEEEHEIILGTLMGDSSIRQRNRYSCLRFSHSKNQSSYMLWKVKKLAMFNSSEFITRSKEINKRSFDMINYATKTHPIFNYYRNLFYDKQGIKRITKKILNQLTPRSLAIWICDDGSYSRTQNYLILCTNSFNFEEHKIMKDFFNKKFGLDPTIGFRDNKYYYLRFKKEDTKKLVKIVRLFIPKCMKYKIGDPNE